MVGDTFFFLVLFFIRKRSAHGVNGEGKGYHRTTRVNSLLGTDEGDTGGLDGAGSGIGDGRVDGLDLSDALVDVLLDGDLVLEEGLLDLLGGGLEDGEGLLGGQLEDVAGLLESRDIGLDHLALDGDITIINKAHQGLEADLDIDGQLGAVLLEVGRERVDLDKEGGGEGLDTLGGLGGDLLDVLLELNGVSTNGLDEGVEADVQGLDGLLGLDHGGVALGSLAQVLGGLGNGGNRDAHAAGDAEGDIATEVDNTGSLVALAGGRLLNLGISGQDTVDDGLEAIDERGGVGVDTGGNGSGGGGSSSGDVVGSRSGGSGDLVAGRSSGGGDVAGDGLDGGGDTGVDGRLDLGVGVLGRLLDVDVGLLDLGHNLGGGLGDDGEGGLEDVQGLCGDLVDLGDGGLETGAVGLGILGDGLNGRTGGVKGVAGVLVVLGVRVEGRDAVVDQRQGANTGNEASSRGSGGTIDRHLLGDGGGLLAVLVGGGSVFAGGGGGLGGGGLLDRLAIGTLDDILLDGRGRGAGVVAVLDVRVVGF